MTKLLVASESFDEGKTNVQIVNLDQENQNLVCENLPNLYIHSRYGSGQLFNGNQPIICSCENCEIYQSGEWKWKTFLSEYCNIAGSAIVTNSVGKEVFLIFYSQNGTQLNLASFDGSVWNHQKTELNFVDLSCIVKIDSSTVLLIGELTLKNQKPENTYFYNAKTNKWTPGPFLKIPRADLSCGILRWRNPATSNLENIVVAAGVNLTNIFR